MSSFGNPAYCSQFSLLVFLPYRYQLIVCRRLVNVTTLAMVALLGCEQEKRIVPQGIEEPEKNEEYSSLETKSNSWNGVVREKEKCVTSLEIGGGESKIGTGFFVSKDGLLVTNFHVIEGAESIRAKNFQGFTLTCQGVVATDEERDLAVLKFAARNLPFLTFVEHSEVEKGEEVMAIGNPMGLDTSVTRGIVSALRKEEGVELIQFDAAISPGSSGSPILNRSGEVLGVATFILKGRQGYNFGVASNHVRELLGLAEALEVIPLSEYAWEENSFVPELEEEDEPLPSAEDLMTGTTSPPDTFLKEQRRNETYLEFLVSYWESFQKPSGAAWARLFAEESQYQYHDDGMATRSDIAKGAMTLKTKYPDRVYNLLSKPVATRISEDVVHVKLDYEYFYTDGKKVVGGVAKTRFVIDWIDNEWLITNFTETVDKYENPSRLFQDRSSTESRPTKSYVGLKKGEAGYMTTIDGNAHIWNNSFQQGDQARWEGERDSQGFGTGEGTLSWFKNGSFQYSYSGRMVKGQLDGPVTTVDRRGNMGRGQYQNGKKSGRWHYVSADGNRTWSKGS